MTHLADPTAPPAPLSPSAPTRVRIERVETSRLPDVDLANVAYSSVFGDHMLYAEYADGAWGEPVIRPYGPLPILPNVSALHYGVSLFEGMKARRGPDGRPLLFRPLENARRMARSARRLAMPEVPESLFLDALRELVRLDAGWVPDADAGALYIRPFLFSLDGDVRVKPAERVAFAIFTFPFGAYFPPAIDALVPERWARAFPGGTGDVKVAGNYAPSLLADVEAREAGFGTSLWLDGAERRWVEECTNMNVFFVFDDGGTRRVVTPSLDGTILPGVTRDSVITLLRDAGLDVVERRVAIDELFALHRAGRLLECFGTGTSVTVTHVRRIRHRGEDLLLPPLEERVVATAVRDRLVAISTGRAPDPYGWVVAV